MTEETKQPVEHTVETAETEVPASDELSDSEIEQVAGGARYAR